MKICYIDESGCTGGIQSATSKIQPALVLTGLIIDASKLHEITDKLLNLKQTWFPKYAPVGTTHMGWILREIKGSDLRKEAAEGTRNQRRHALGYIGKSLEAVDACNAKLTGRVWIKGIGLPFNGHSVYTYSIQSIYEDFQNYLGKEDDYGIVILDARLKHFNTPVAHSIFTQKFKHHGDTYSRVLELPSFCHSDNHACLQYVDLICSAIVTPIAVHTYCSGHITSIHVRPGYIDIKKMFADRCKTLQHRYTASNGRTRGGLIVSDAIGQRPGGEMFR